MGCSGDRQESDGGFAWGRKIQRPLARMKPSDPPLSKNRKPLNEIGRNENGKELIATITPEKRKKAKRAISEMVEEERIEREKTELENKLKTDEQLD